MARIATSVTFQNITLVVVILNCLYIFPDADYNEASNLMDAQPIFIYSELFFAVFFTIEIVIRFLAFEDKRNTVKDFWFKCDFALAVMIYLENAVLIFFTEFFGNERWFGTFSNLLRSVKLLKLFRAVRIARAMPELVTVIRAVFTIRSAGRGCRCACMGKFLSARSRLYHRRLKQYVKQVLKEETENVLTIFEILRISMV